MGGSSEDIDPNTDWFRWCRDKKNIKEGKVSGNLPENGPGFWKYFKKDLALAAEGLKNNAIRLGVEWSRVFPESTEKIPVHVNRDENGNIIGAEVTEEDLNSLEEIANAQAVKKYREIFREAIKQGLAVMVSLNHFTLPIWLHDPIKCRDGRTTNKRGWVSSKTAVEFAKYSAFAAKTFGDLVDLWTTMIEPVVVAKLGYLYPKAGYPPGVADPKAYLEASRNLATAHALAYEQIKRWDILSATDFGPSYVGVVFDPADYQPYRKNEADVEAARSHWYVFNEWFLNAALNGEFDMNMDGVVEEDESIPKLAKRYDYIGVDYYMRMVVKSGESGLPFLKGRVVPPKGHFTDVGWEIYPPGIKHVVKWTHEKYGCPIILTENGIADEKDKMRKSFIISHLRKLHEAIEDGVPILGYFHWTLVDNLEWSRGFSKRFGLYTIDHETKVRKPTKAVPTYRKICGNNAIF